ncbi:MAG: hypothetical protein ACD_9C00344G0005 [uncultured bacterium]|nr:MAG: hypothetical protein ACD_9C00344G0005 [uncultured bacterium]
MRISLFAAMSLDGFIADDNGNEDFLSDVHWAEFTKIAEKIGCFVVSRKAYDAVNKWDDEDNIKAKKIIVSKNSQLELKKGYLLASSPESALDVAAENGCDEVLVAGGGQLNRAFLENDLVDEIFLTIEPCILGKGVDFVAGSELSKKLKLVDVEKLENGIVRLNYEVIK